MSAGAGREAVLFIHSTGTGPLLWSGVDGAAVGSRERLFPANLGYAPNPPIARGTSVTAADDAAQVLSGIPADLEHIHVVAHSYGGLVALILSRSLGARVASMFLYEPVVFGALAKSTNADPDAAAQARAFVEHPWFLHDVEKGGGEEWLEMFIDYWNRPGSWSKMPEPLREMTRAVGWKMFQEVRDCFFEPTPFEGWSITAPTTIAIGERSPAASQAMSRALAAGRSSVTTEELPKTGHMAPLTHPAVVHEALGRHMARVAKEPR